MWNPVNAFLGLSPFKRVVLVILLMLMVSVGTTVFGIYTYVTALGRDVNQALPGSNDVVSGFSNPASARISEYLADCRELDALATESWQLVSGSASVGLPLERQRRIETVLSRVSRQPVDSLLMFNRFDWPGDSLPNLRLYRERVRFIASYSLLMKEANPGFDLVRPLQALQRQHLMVESWPCLISRMVGVAGMGIEDRVLNRLLAKDLIPVDEAGRVLELLEQTGRFRPTFRETMFAETQLMERSYYRLAAKAPLGTWIMDSIYGDPLVQFRDLASRSESIDKDELWGRMEKDFGLSTPRTHLLVMISFPNVIRARERILEKEAFHAIVLAQLAARAGIQRVITDPLGGAPLRSRNENGRTVFYSVGPNGKDDGMAGDDIF